MAQLMDNNIIRISLRKKNNFIIKIKISFLAAASPSCSLITNTYSSIFETIRIIEIFQFFFNQIESLFFVFLVFFFTASSKQLVFSNSWFLKSLNFLNNPFWFFKDESFHGRIANPPRSRNKTISVAMNGYSYVPRLFTFSKIIFNVFITDKYFSLHKKTRHPESPRRPRAALASAVAQGSRTIIIKFYLLTLGFFTRR